jgi:rhomboid protease GluP
MDSLAPRPPDAPLAIPVRNRQQAMDWSLALASQGIVATILHDETAGQWALQVDGPDGARALATLKQYHVENRGWRWEQPVPGTELRFHWGALLWCLWLAVIHAVIANGATGLRTSGMMDAAALRAGEWWRAFTAVSLHGDWAHLASNATTGFVLFGLVMARFGAGAGLLAAWLAGVAAYLPGMVIYGGDYRALGASGMVMAALGMLAADAASHSAGGFKSVKTAFAAIGGGLMLFVLLGSNPGSDLVAHAAGFVFGGLAGWLLARVPVEKLMSTRARVLSLTCFVVPVAGTWWVAMQRHSGN